MLLRGRRRRGQTPRAMSRRGRSDDIGLVAEELDVEGGVAAVIVVGLHDRIRLTRPCMTEGGAAHRRFRSFAKPSRETPVFHPVTLPIRPLWRSLHGFRR